MPPKPAYLRVKVWRRLQKLGSVAVKNSVYILPATDETCEDFQWIRREIVANRGEATVCEAHFIEGLNDQQIEQLFQLARKTDYGQIIDDARRLGSSWPKRRTDPARSAEASHEVARLQRRLDEVDAIDFFKSPGRDEAARILSRLAARLADTRTSQPSACRTGRRPSYKGFTWVTRAGVHVDRIASAWFIRCFIDDEAKFKFVSPGGYRPAAGEICFDMYEAEFTHEGDRCTFEILVRRFRPRLRALIEISQIVHDIDLRDGKFARAEAAGLAGIIRGITMACRSDEERIARGSELLDALYAHLARRGR
jgi:hypothetical protein